MYGIPPTQPAFQCFGLFALGKFAQVLQCCAKALLVLMTQYHLGLIIRESTDQSAAVAPWSHTKRQP